MKLMRQYALIFSVGAVALAAVVAGLTLSGSTVRARNPADVLWIWHSSDAPVDARELAVLLDSIQIFGKTMEVRPRRRALSIRQGVAVTPVVHVQLIDTATTLNDTHANVIEESMLSALSFASSRIVQLDFEFPDEQRDYFLSLVSRLRLSLPADTKLSVTLQARWCDAPEFLSQLKADEIVPMFFRMGDGRHYRQRLENSTGSLAKQCRTGGIGTAIQEPLPAYVLGRYARRYWFNFGNWPQGRS